MSTPLDIKDKPARELNPPKGPKKDAPWSKSFAFSKDAPVINGSRLNHTTSSSKTFRLPGEGWWEK